MRDRQLTSKEAAPWLLARKKLAKLRPEAYRCFNHRPTDLMWTRTFAKLKGLNPAQCPLCGRRGVVA